MPDAPADHPATALTALQRACDHLASELDRELDRAHGLSLRTFELLWTVQRLAPDGWLRMRELTAHAHLSQSRISRLVKQLEQRRLVRRRADGNDGRGVEVSLTREGHRTVRDAGETHERSLRRLVAAHLDPEEVEQLTALTGRLLPPGPEPPIDARRTGRPTTSDELAAGMRG